ncbi:MAG: hypothetical protein Q7R33_06820, partial [Nitrosarchaeum sp.]|nr:hypothetical protein [Nitrosarchaeum sp.]
LSSVFLQKPNTTNTKAQTVNDSKCPGKMDVSGACNPACCSRDTDSSNPDINCPSGQTCTHANGYCTGGSLGQFSCEPKGSKGKSICTQNQCSWILCNPNDSSCCDSQSDPRCQLCNSNDECVGVNPAPPITNGNQCFSLSAKVSQEPITGGIKFITNTIITNKARIGAHIQMWVNGNQTLFNNYNKINEGTINYEVGGEYSGSPIIVMKGESATITYRVKEDECNNLGNEDSLTCTFSVDNVGNPYSSCGLTNPPAKIPGSNPNGGTSTVTTPGTTGDITTFPKCDIKKINDCVGFGGTIFVDDKEFTPLTNDEFVQIKALSTVSNYEKILPDVKSSIWSWMGEAKSGTSYHFLAMLKRGNTVISNPDDTIVNKIGPNLNLNFHLSRNGTSTGTYTTGILQSFTMIGSISSGNIDDFDFSP